MSEAVYPYGASQASLGQRGASRGNGSTNSSRNLASRKLQMKDVLRVDWRDAQIFKDYVCNDWDRNYKFRDAANGTLTPAQVSQIDKIQITISNKNVVAQQIKATASILLQELVPESWNQDLQEQLQARDPSNGQSLMQLELQKFLQIGNMSQIETLNKQLDKLQKYFRVRSELLSVLASIRSCEEMLQDTFEAWRDY